MKVNLTLLLLSYFCMGGAYAADSCLQYSPSSVKLSGELKRLTFPGRPNYESVASGDEEEAGFYLVLSKELCVDGDKQSADSYPQQKVRLVQLVLDSNGYSKLRSLLGSDVTLNGTLFARHTGHHHAPLLLQNVTLSKRRAQ
jgi:hypothetical protein